MGEIGSVLLYIKCHEGHSNGCVKFMNSII